MKTRSCFSTLITVIFIIACIGLVITAVATLWLPTQAEQIYGPPVPDLNPIDRIVLSVRMLLNQDQLTNPMDPSGIPLDFVIEPGESTFEITKRLEVDGFIPNASAMRDYLVYTGMDTTLQAGEFTLRTSLTPIQIASELQDATPQEISLNILPGWRMEEIAETLPSSGLNINPEAFFESVRSPNWRSDLQNQFPSNATLEGFLYPDSYRLSRQISTEALIATLLENFQIKVTFEIQQGFQQQGINLYQAVTLASIVQREAVIDEEMPLIASVFYNRLSAGMKLETDPTVQYAIGYYSEQNSWWKVPLTREDLNIDSPFNTYLYAGLPTAPISNPGLNALQAVAYPAQTPYFYFRSACDGSGRHSFAETFQEHQDNACPE